MTDQYEDPPEWDEIPPILSIADVALIFNVTTTTVHRWIAKGQIKSYRWFGRTHVFPREYILEFADPAVVERISEQAQGKWGMTETRRESMEASRREIRQFKERFGMKP